MVTDKHHRMGYSIGGVIANLAYNGDKFWGDVQPSRQSMLEFMVSVASQNVLLTLCGCMKGYEDATVGHRR